MEHINLLYGAIIVVSGNINKSHSIWVFYWILWRKVYLLYGKPMKGGVAAVKDHISSYMALYLQI